MNYIVSEEELIKLMNDCIKTIHYPLNKIDNFLKSKQPVEMVAVGEIQEPENNKFYLIDEESENPIEDLFAWLKERYDGKFIEIYIKEIK
jgi:hypothetical protein